MDVPTAEMHHDDDDYFKMTIWEQLDHYQRLELITKTPNWISKLEHRNLYQCLEDLNISEGNCENEEEFENILHNYIDCIKCGPACPYDLDKRDVNPDSFFRVISFRKDLFDLIISKEL